MKLSYAARTDVGMIRTGNEDNFVVDANGDRGVFMVADGMGGHAAGEVARNDNWPAATLAAASALVAGNASAEVEYELHTGYTSEYLFRGLNLGQDLVRAYIEKRGGTADRPDVRWKLFAELLSSPRLPSGLR